MKAPVELLWAVQTGLALRADPGDAFAVALVVGLGVVLLLFVNALARPARAGGAA